jgi:phosphate transport system protein
MPDDHTVAGFSADMRAIRSQVAEMGALVEMQIANAVTALSDYDPQLAESVIALDLKVDLMQREVEQKVIETIARRQPFATDLRATISAFRIASDLERIGDLAGNICNRALALDQVGPRLLLPRIAQLSTLVRDQLKRVLASYIEADAGGAAEVWQRDVEVDAMHKSLFLDLLTSMMEDPRNITSCAHLLFCSKNMERMGDHATNIAESVRYMITGDRFTDDRPKGDDTSLMVPFPRS